LSVSTVAGYCDLRQPLQRSKQLRVVRFNNRLHDARTVVWELPIMIFGVFLRVIVLLAQGAAPFRMRLLRWSRSHRLAGGEQNALAWAALASHTSIMPANSVRRMSRSHDGNKKPLLIGMSIGRPLLWSRGLVSPSHSRVAGAAIARPSDKLEAHPRSSGLGE
jgi:hypothetical protein